MDDQVDDNTMNSNRINDDNQGHDGRRNRTMRDGKPNFRLLIPSRHAG
ncbi:unnamed protein product, partial [Rotaria magnacalcarata]